MRKKKNKNKKPKNKRLDNGRKKELRKIRKPLTFSLFSWYSKMLLYPMKKEHIPLCSCSSVAQPRWNDKGKGHKNANAAGWAQVKRILLFV